MRGTKYSITAAAIILCAVMLLVACAPLAVGEAGEHLIIKGPKGPRASAVTWVYETGPDAGMWSGLVDNNGLRSIVVDVADNTTGIPDDISHERIRFAAYDAYPTGTIETGSVLMNANSIYEITITPNGPRSSEATITDQFETAVPPTASFTWTVTDATVNVDASGSTDDGLIVSYDWNWGDGSMGSGVTAMHTYTATGTYTITLTVTDDMGLTDSTSDDVYVEIITPESPVTVTISNMFELYLKPTDYSKLGRWGDTLGYNSWMDLRKPNYAEWMVTTTYPFVMAYNPYSTMTTPEVDIGAQLCSWYRMYIDATEQPGAATGPGMDPLFVPIMGSLASDGGVVTMNLYSTYMTTQDMTDARLGLHYANTYYGVPLRATPVPSSDDGYWHELQGTMSFDRNGCQKFLGMTATGDLEDEFNVNKAMIEGMWFDDWMIEGSGSGLYDIYTAYDYPNDIRTLVIIVDPDLANSNPDILYLRIYSISWGNDVLLWRYIEAAGLMSGWQAWADDWYLNVTIDSDSFDLSMRGVMGYQLAATTDGSNPAIAAWSLEAMHLDWCGNTATHSSYISPYNPYDPDTTDGVLKMNYAPGTVNYGQRCSYAVAPMIQNLAAGDTWIIKLDTLGPVIGYPPYTGTSDVLTDAKIAEYAANSVTGTLAMGTGYPTNLVDYYDAGTNTLTLVGPMTFPANPNPDFPSLLESGSPTVMFNVV